MALFGSSILSSHSTPSGIFFLDASSACSGDTGVLKTDLLLFDESEHGSVDLDGL